MKEVYQFLAETNDVRAIGRFFSEMFTTAEIQDLNKRWEIISGLMRGETQRSIARNLHVSLCKITRGSKELKKDGSLLRKIFETQLSK